MLSVDEAKSFRNVSIFIKLIEVVYQVRSLVTFLFHFMYLDDFVCVFVFSHCI